MRELSLLEGLERGFRGTERTIRKMHRLVALGKVDPTMQRIATWVRLGVPQDRRGSGKETAEAVFRFIARHGIFQRDPFQVEKIEHPIASMVPVIRARRSGVYSGPGLFVGDCDTISAVWVATLAGILGFQYAFETAKLDPRRPDEFSHVWTSLRIGKDWYPLDPSTAGIRPGWKPPGPPEAFRLWPEDHIEESIGMSGMNGQVVPETQYGQRQPEEHQFERGTVPESDFSPTTDLVPLEPGIPEGELLPGLEWTRKAPDLHPSNRSATIYDLSPEDIRPTYRDTRPGYSVERGHSPWNDPVRVQPRTPTRAGVSMERKPWPWSKDVDAVMLPSRTWNGKAAPTVPVQDAVQSLRKEGGIVLRPELKSMGLGQPLSQESARRIMASTLSGQPALVAQRGVLDDIGDAFKRALVTIPGVATETARKVAEAYAQRVSGATQRVTGEPAPVLPVPIPTEPAWYARPAVLVGGLSILAAGGAAYYFATREPDRKRFAGVRRRR